MQILQNLASMQPRTSLVKFSRSPRTDRPGLHMVAPFQIQHFTKKSVLKISGFREISAKLFFLFFSCFFPFSSCLRQQQQQAAANNSSQQQQQPAAGPRRTEHRNQLRLAQKQQKRTTASRNSQETQQYLKVISCTLSQND